MSVSSHRALLGATILGAALGGCAAHHAAPSIVRTNAFTSSTQAHAVADRAPDGSYVVAWDSRRQQSGQYGVYARLLDADGRPLGPEIQANLHTPSAQMRPAVACAPDGAVWIAWQSNAQDGDAWGVIARRLDADLRAGSTEIGVNQTRAGSQAEPVVAVAPSGVSLVAWTSESDGRIAAMARLFAPDGSALTDEIPLGDASDRRETTITADAVGDTRFAVAWTGVDADDRSRIAARLLDDDGTLASGELTIASGATDQVEPSLAADGAGGFGVAWMAADLGGYAVRARAFDDAGRPGGPATTIAPADAAAARHGAAIAHLGGSTWLVAFNEAGEEADVLGARADLGAGRVSRPTPLTGSNDAPRALDAANGARRIVAGPDGAIALAWSGNAGLGDDSGVHLSIIRPGVDGTRWPADAGEGEVAGAVASPHIPPTFDPDFVAPARDPLLGGDGPDFGFEAIPFTGWTPPDPEMAVGPEHLVGITNGNISFFNKQGDLLFSDQIEGAGGFWGAQGAGGFVFDPEALWDEHHQRFWAMCCERTGGQSYFLVAVSDDANPVGTWHKYRINVTPIPGIGGDIDSPNFAVSPDHVYLTADFFSPGTRFLVHAVPTAPLLAGQPAPAGTSIVNTGTQSFGIPQHADESAPRQYLIETTEFNLNSVVRLHAVEDPDGTPSLATFTLDVPDYRYPGSPSQKGSGVTPILFEPRMWSCEYANGSLWAVHHIRRPDASNTIVRWYEIAMNGWPVGGQDPTLVQWGEIDPGGSTHAYFPSIGANADGDAAITFSRSSSSEYISMWRATRRAGDAPGTFGEMTLVKASSTPQTSGRWGDYSQTRSDPSRPCVFWGHNEWTFNTGSWSTWMASYVNAHPADLNEDCELSILDFVAFQNLFTAGDPRADFNGDGVLNILDFVAYQNAFLS